MKSFKPAFLILILSLFISETIHAQTFPKMDASPMDLAMAQVDRKTAPIARVIYSRPQKNGRKIFGELVPFGEVWRTGANEATELTLYKKMSLGNKTLEPGTYTLYTIPGEEMWTVIINGDMNTWGAYSYKEEKDIVRITVPARDAAAPIESLSMIFRPESDGTTLLIGWDNAYVEVPFKNI